MREFVGVIKKNLQEGGVQGSLLALHVLDHHNRGQRLDDLERLRGAVPLLLLLLLVQVTWEGPESVRVNCGDYIPFEDVPNKVRLQQRSTKKLMTFTYY